MNIVCIFIDCLILMWIIILGCFFGGFWGFFIFGCLEDLVFIIKIVVVVI